MTEPQTPSAVAASRIKEARRVRGWSVRELAERCAAAGAPELTDNVIENIERGRRASAARRGRDITIDQWLVLAYVLNTAPLALVLPAVGDAIYQVTPQAAVPATRVGRWLLGWEPLRPNPVPDPDNPGEFLPQHPGIDAERYHAEWPPYLGTLNDAELQKKVALAVDQEISRKIGDIEALVATELSRHAEEPSDEPGGSHE